MVRRLNNMMTLYRQKLFSSFLTEALYKTGKVKNKITTLPAKLTRDFYRRTGNLEQHAIAEARLKEGTKSSVQLKKEAIAGNNKYKTKTLELLNATTTPERTKKYIGDKVGKFTETAAENPVSTAGTVFGYGSTPIQVMTGSYWGPIGTASVSLEQGLKKASKSYNGFTKRAGERARRKHWGDKASGATIGALNYII